MEAENNDNQIGFRMQYLEVLNWGTFHKKIWRIEPDGNNSLLTGSIGSGKSTIVDAITTLIVPHNKITFNKAAGAEGKERNLVSYIKGYYSSKSDDLVTGGKSISLRYKDPLDTTFTVLVANFFNGGYNTNVTLSQVFWIENDKVHKIFLVSLKPLTIQEHFSNIVDPKTLRKKLKDLSFIESYEDNFSQYSQRFRHLFGMNSEKAIELFYQTVSMKSVSSLTSFVREQMLEKTDIKAQIEDLKKRYDELNRLHSAVLEARNQRDILRPLVEHTKNYDEIEGKIKDIDEIVKLIPSYFALKKIEILTEEIKNCERNLLKVEGQLKAVEEELRIKRKAQADIQKDIDDNGGLRLKEISREIEEREKSKSRKKDAHEKYIELTKFCELPTASTEKTFYKNMEVADNKIETFSVRQNQILEEHGSFAGRKKTIEESIESSNNELESLKGRINQIPLEILNIREELSAGLGIDKNEIPFAGELLKVNDENKSWEGALERLLGGLGVSMLVPEKHYSQVSAYVNSRTLKDHKGRGAKLDYLPVRKSFRQNNYQIDVDPDSAVNKIDIKPGTEFEDWLQNELETRYNIRCVSIQEFQKVPRDVMTIEGQIKRGNKHTKDDRRHLWDIKNFVLGWSNTEKIKAIQLHIDELKEEKRSLTVQISELTQENKNNTTYQGKLQQIKDFKNWNELNWQDEVLAINQLRQEKADLENSNDILRTLQEKLEQVLKEIEREEKSKVDIIGKQTTLNNNVSDYRQLIDDSNEEIAKAGDLQNKNLYYPGIADELADKDFTIRNIDRERQSYSDAKREERRGVIEKQNSFRDKIIRQMREYKNQFPSQALDLTDEIDRRNEFVKKHDDIVSEGLPEHERKFKEMLNKNTIEDIAGFDNKLDMHEKSIKSKIETINKHLREIVYDKNKETYIKLLADRNFNDKEIEDFKRELKDCYSGILDTNDAYTEERFIKVQKILNRFRSNQPNDIDWTNKVTDVRNRFIFNARENFIATDEEYQFYAGSSGKSGGQKEKLAYTILASALAYQFGLSYGEPKSKTFRFVVIDEAFGRGDDESTQFGLGLFEKLNLQLLIVTPLQKIHVIENYINSVHYVSNTEGNDSQLQNLSVEEYKNEKHLYNQQTGIKITETKND